MITASDNKENKPIVNEHTDLCDPVSPEANDSTAIEKIIRQSLKICVFDLQKRIRAT